MTVRVGQTIYVYLYTTSEGYRGPLAAIVAKVVNVDHVNLTMIGEDGTTVPMTGVKFVGRPTEPIPTGQDYCTDYVESPVGEAARMGYKS